ncbi:MAG: fibronectin type III domain-containing protein, partial [Crocinitomicaceae bacterium]|nr:fibronectin type III domain-containing protein [Crocinitomicaceae bacterium]
MKKVTIFFFGFLLFLQFLFVGGAWGQNVETFSTSGTYTWVCPAGVTSVQVEAWGGGGAGGGTTSSGTNKAGGGGGGGAYQINSNISVVPGSSYTIVVGAGGTGVSGSNGNNGQSSSFNTTSIVANGGNGGNFASTSAVVTGGAGGIGSFNGGTGATSLTSGSGNSGGGGGSAGSTGNGGSPTGTSAGIAGSGTTGKNGGAGAAGRTSNGIGTSATNVGGGGSGARQTGATASAGGAGGSGRVILTYTCPSVSTFPYTESFEGISNGIPICWGLAGSTTTGSIYHFSSFATGQTGKGLRFDSYSNTSGNTSELITPTLNLSSLTTAELKFYFKNPTGGNFEVLISTDNGTTYTSLQSLLTGQSSWLQKTYTITSYISSTVKIKFKGTSNYGNGDAYVYLDEIQIQSAPSCMIPTALTSSAISYQTATIAWTAPTSGTAPQGYEYEVRTSGASGSGATGLVTSGSTTAPTVSANITGLIGATAYSYYVRSNCGGGDFSSWTSAGTFTTTSCTIPTTLSASSITTSSATISWVAPVTGSPAGYEYEVRTSGGAGSGATGLISSGTTTAPTVSASLSGLTAATVYSVYLRSNCYSGFNSAWTSAFTLTTGCETPISTAASVSSSVQTLITISGTFTAAATAPSGYLVVRTLTNTQPTPATGTTYSVGSNAIGYIEYVGTAASSWTSSGLTSGTTYYYWVFSYNNTTCFGGPVYSSSASTLTQTTESCPVFASVISINGSTAVSGTSYPTLTAAITALSACGVS